MKRTILKLVSIATIAATFFACTTKIEQEAVPNFQCEQDGQLAPKWTCNPYLEGSIVALGIAPKNAGNDYGMQRIEAMAAGRDGLVRQLDITVSNLYKSFTATTGKDTSGSYEKATSNVSKQLASESLKGSRGIESWKSDAGTLYILVGLSNNQVKESINNAAKTSLNDENAMFQKFLANQANEELAAELKKANK